jgi:signal transduction histidine kinase
MFSKWRESFRHAFALRLGLWYVGLFIASALALSAFTYLLLGRALAAQDHDVLESMLSRYAGEYSRAGLDELKKLIDADAGEGRHERLLVRVVNDQKELPYFTTPPAWSGFDLTPLDDPASFANGWTSIAGADGTVLEVGARHLRNGVTVQVGRSSHLRAELLRRFRDGAAEVLLLIVVVGVAGGGLLTYVGLAPVRSLETTLRSILRTGRFDARVTTRGSRDPLDELGGLVNDMLGRMQKLVGGMRGALDNVAHDLRTPLTRFRNVAESALVEGDAAATREGLARALDESARVNATLTALMDISEAETGTMALRFERLRLAAVAAEAVSLFADEAEDKSIALTVAIDPAIELTADRARLRQVLANLIENAIKYTGRGGRVGLEARPSADSVTATVRDTGIGIAPEDLPFVWDRLFRADASRSARGLGLGLSLVKAIVEGHGGSVSVTSTLGHGSEFTVTFPR